MAFDGVTIHVLLKELEKELLGGRIDKIYQVEADEVVLSVRSLGKGKKLLLSASASHARLQLTEKPYETPLNPPMFCMLLRKHLGGGKITGIRQINGDRIVEILVEVLNDLGDYVSKRLVLEMMGKHSNLMLLDETGRIIDAIRHVSQKMSSVRLVMPGLMYELPHHNVKLDLRTAVQEEKTMERVLLEGEGQLEQLLINQLQGISPFTARELLFRAELEPRATYGDLTTEEKDRLHQELRSFLDEMEEGPFAFLIYTDKAGKNVDFSAVPYRMMFSEDIGRTSFESLSALMDVFYERRDTTDKMRQKTQDLRHLLSTNLERVNKKLHLQKKQMEDTKDRDKDRMWGDLVTANLYQIQEGMSRVEVVNYYEESMPTVSVRLDPNLTPSQNAQKYYERYNKLKRTEEALTLQIASGEEEKAYLESLLSAVALADCEQDIEDIREEMRETGYLKKISQKTRAKKNLMKSKPLSFVTSEGVEGLIGKNNLQNDQLTFKRAEPRDEWFHVKDMPGSHVILKTGMLVMGKDYTEKSLLEAAFVAALYSRGENSNNVPVDHTKKMYVKKPQGAKPGFVIYTHQETIFVKDHQMEEAKSLLVGKK